jgi:hypothetical protein
VDCVYDREAGYRLGVKTPVKNVPVRGKLTLENHDDGGAVATLTLPARELLMPAK